MEKEMKMWKVYDNKDDDNDDDGQWTNFDKLTWAFGMIWYTWFGIMLCINKLLACDHVTIVSFYRTPQTKDTLFLIL